MEAWDLIGDTRMIAVADAYRHSHGNECDLRFVMPLCRTIDLEAIAAGVPFAEPRRLVHIVGSLDDHSFEQDHFPVHSGFERELAQRYCAGAERA